MCALCPLSSRPVRKSSIYLPDELKGALAELSRRSGRSEANLIRSAIEQLVEAASALSPSPAVPGPPLPRPPLPRPAVVGVGVGPGDPVLVTERARQVLEAADRVLVVTTDIRSVGRAEMVVRSACPVARVQRVAFAVGGDATARQHSLDGLVGAALDGADASELVAVAVLGDPYQWTIFPALAAAVRDRRPGVTVDAIPGITAWQALAAHATVPLAGPGAALVVVDDLDGLDRHLGDPGACVVVYKASTDATSLRAVASRHGRRGAVVGELTGLPGERHVDLDELADGPLPYLSTVVFPAVAVLPARTAAAAGS
jgi:precorrin-2/cobalt-factor-2 C20-methyltransferase